MAFISDLMRDFSGLFTPHLDNISFALIAAVLVIYGSNIIGAVRRVTRKQHFMIRTLAFICLCAFGFGLLGPMLADYLEDFLTYFGRQWTGILVIISFLAVGYLAEKRNYH